MDSADPPPTKPLGDDGGSRRQAGGNELHATEPIFSPGARFAEKYRIEKKLGEGGFGSVYLVRNDLDMAFALKVLNTSIASDEATRKRFLREMRISMEITHPNAVPVRDADVWRGSLYYTMEVVEGPTVAELLKEGRGIAPERVIDWACQILSFLEFLHDKGYAHRDLKPANLIVQKVDRRDRIRVLDLGIAKALAPDDLTDLTGPMTIGTPNYMAPEHLAGDPIDHRADLYAVGVILYESSSGQRPFSAATTRSLRHKVLNEPPRPIPEILSGYPVDLWRVIERSLRKDPDDRHPDARSFRLELEELGLGGALAATAALTKLEPTRHRRWPLWGGISLMAVATVVTWIAWPRSSGPRNDGRAPKARILVPKEGTEISTNEVEVVLALDGEVKGIDYADTIHTPTLRSDGNYVVRLPVPGEGSHELALRVFNASGESRVRTTVTVDRRAPSIVSVSPQDSVTGLKAQITVTADEDLSPATRIGGLEAQIRGKIATAEIEAQDYGVLSIPIVLVDRLENRRLDSRAIEFRRERVTLPPAIEILQPARGLVVNSRTVTVRIQVSGTGPLEARVQGKPVPVAADGVAQIEMPTPEVSGNWEVHIDVKGAGGSAEERLSLIVDKDAPTLVSVHPSPQTWILPGTRRVEIVANEALGEGSRIGAVKLTLNAEDKRKALASVEITDGSSLEVHLVDALGNTKAPEPLAFRVARIPKGMEPAIGTPIDDRGLPRRIREPQTGIELALVPPTPAGGFPMGAVVGDQDSRENESPQHAVTLSRAYYLGVTEVTWDQLLVGVMRGGFEQPKAFPDKLRVDHWEGERVTNQHPAVDLTWDQALEFCHWLGASLPSEAQWEWACRCEATCGLYWWGNDFEDGAKWANVADESSPFGSKADPPIGQDDTFTYAAPVKTFGPSPSVGLYDMTGNVMEWCRDHYREHDYRNRAGDAPVSDPEGAVSRSDDLGERVLRGGSFRHGAVASRVSHRAIAGQGRETREDFIGFRICLVVDED